MKKSLIFTMLLLSNLSFAAANTTQTVKSVVKDIAWVNGTGGRYSYALAINAVVPEYSYNKVQILVPKKDGKNLEVVWESEGTEELQITFGTGEDFYDYALYINGTNVRNMPHLWSAKLLVELSENGKADSVQTKKARIAAKGS